MPEAHLAPKTHSKSKVADPTSANMRRVIILPGSGFLSLGKHKSWGDHAHERDVTCVRLEVLDGYACLLSLFWTIRMKENTVHMHKHTSMHRHTQALVQEHTRKRTSTCVHMHAYAQPTLHTLTYLHTYILTFNILAYIHTYIRIYLHTYIRTYSHYIYILTYLHTDMLTYLHTCIITYVHTYILTSLHPYIHTYIHK